MLTSQNLIVKEDSSILEDPPLFMEHFTGLKPYPYQADFLRSNEKRYAIRVTRQGGKSLMIAMKALYRSFTSPDELILIVSAYQKQSNEIYEHIRNVIERNEYFRGKLIRFTRKELKWDNGSRIIVLPAGVDGRSSRGFSPTMLIFDETAYINQEVFEALLPSLAFTDGDLVLSSTPFGMTGFFFDAFNGKMSKEYKKIHITCHDCPGFTPARIEKLKAEAISDLHFRQEYMSEFLEDVDTFFSLRLYNKCKVETEKDGPEGGKSYILGVDCARQGLDQTAYGITEVDVQKKTLTVVKWLVTSKKDTNDIEGRIRYLHEIYRFSKIFVDVSFIGGAVIDHLKEADPNLPIEGVDFHSKTKGDLYKTLKAWMSNDPPQIQFLHNEHLKMQMLNLRYSFTSQGMLKLEPPPKGNDDMVDVLSLICKYTFLASNEDDFYIGSV